jgi:DNA-binding transcriptional ArsR family regulator
MVHVKIASMSRLGADARRQILDALKETSDAGRSAEQIVEDGSASSSKMRNIRTQVDGITFDSLDEAARYGELKIEERAGLIVDLRVHKPFRLVVNDVHVCDYESDFAYRRDEKLVVEDVKSPGTITYAYRIKKKLMLALYGIQILEVFQD